MRTEAIHMEPDFKSAFDHQPFCTLSQPGKKFMEEADTKWEVALQYGYNMA